MAKRGRPKGSKNKKKKNVPNNFRGAEDKFWTRIFKGLRDFLQSPFK